MHKGFTLIELLVVIAIVGLLTATSAVAIVSAKNKRTTKAVAEQVKNVIMEAHAYAISPKTKDISGGVVPDGRPVVIVVQAHSIEVQMHSYEIIQPIFFPSNITLSCSNPTANPCISFENSNSNTIGQTTTSNNIVVTKTGTGEQYNVAVGKLSGNVTITTP